MAKRTKQPKVQASIARWRFYGAGAALCLLGVVLLWHVAGLQVIPGEDKGFEFLQGQGAARTVRTEPISAYRGVITDRYGEPLAVSTPVVSIWANPNLLPATQSNVATLAKALGLNASAVKSKLDKYSDKEFVYLRRHLPPQDADKVLSKAIPGVFAQTEYRRFYPAAEVTSHLVGFTNIDDRGQEGMELAHDQWLTGIGGAKRVVKDLKGHVIKEEELLRAAQPGKGLTLSIDLRLQYLAYRELKATVTEHQARGGSVVVLDTVTGEVLAIANQPAYNPNDRRRMRPADTRNRAIIDQFEPGSTMKPVTVMAALETRRYSPHTLVNTSPGYIRVGRKTLLDPRDYGVIDVTKIITKSSQVGLTKLALDLDPQQIRDMYFRLGLGQSTGSGFPGESVGLLPNRSRWHPIEQANFAFGYGLTLTALQLAQAYSVIANHGVKKPVSLIKLTGEPVTENVVDAEITRQVLSMMKTVVGPKGTAKRAHLDAYTVAGKTGTVHKVGPQGYEVDRKIALFAGIAPVEKPRIVTVTVVDEPSRGEYFGGQVAAPLFSKVAAGALRLLDVTPQDSSRLARRSATTKAAAVKPAAQTAAVEHREPLT
ncbi:penicillin-binding protein 2 [Exilibacterium tricleocarpae]|uniref:Peptidoglycan D,D-transpeptidase FtsI n=1 Tax=Exilibacterium tricleocarpae TaxID=2591008 RepID=A0A545TQD0_9GAMM|nr:penicillin-binding transpeptidase domain-containing protein [Exilibacterium tricleocarpae]TQV79420.1 penicillin-binding protein 2 [Exilibacterium tricleocarpae]